MTQDYQAVGNVPIGPYNAAIDRDVDGVERQAVGIDIGSVVANVWTPSRVSATNPIPTTASSADKNGTWSTVVVNGSSGTLLAANSSRKRFSIVHNSGSLFIYVKFGTGASSSSYNIILNAQTAYISDLYEYAGDVSYATSGGSFNILVGEQT